MNYKEKLIALLEDSKELSQEQKEKLESIFPELAESDDERIRKEMIDVFSGKKRYATPEESNKYIMWLEKQDEKKLNPHSGTSFEYNGHTWGMCARDNGVEILIDSELKAFVSLDKSFIYPIIPQPIIVPKSALEAIKEEKVDNQNCVKPADKVEPKFKVGDWVVNKLGGSWHIDSFDNKNYQVSDGKGNYNYFPISKQDEMHLWTIGDAKDGDVLQLGKITALFKEFIGNGTCRCYFSVYKGKLKIPGQYWDNDVYVCHNATPATKEQHDILIKAMTDAGYTFDFEKRELNKIEQIPTYEEMKDAHYTEYEKGRADAIVDMQKPTQETEPFEAEHGKYYYCIKDYFCCGKKQASKGDVIQALRGLPIMGLKDASEYFLPVNSIKYNSALSEEDEKILNSIIEEIRPYGECPDYPTDEDREYYYGRTKMID